VVVDYTPVAYAACAVLMALALFRDDLFELLPVARSAVLDALTEVVIAVDRSGRVVDVNRAATAVLAAPATSLVGESLERLVPELTPAVTELSRPVEVTLARAPERTFELRTSRFGFEGDEVAGQLLVMRDISMRKQAEGELHAAREKLEEANRELRRLVDTDVLTGLSNRRYLMAKLDAEVRRARRNKKAVALIVLDLDRFKTINDRYGHAVGDQVLVGCAEVLAAAKRANDIAARYGGEEFVVLLPETDAEGALVFAQRLRKDLNSRTFAAAENTRFRVTASYGVAAMPGDQVDVEELLRLGDLRMYRAKEEGRDRICATGGELRTNFAEAAGGG
jgi:diguanylate cyclase (GGDEF)-like protein